MDITICTDADHCTVCMAGRFSAGCNDRFIEAVQAAMSESPKDIVIDLDGVQYIDSTGLGLLLIVRDKVHRAGKTIALANARQNVAQVLRIARFDKLFNMQGEGLASGDGADSDQAKLA